MLNFNNLYYYYIQFFSYYKYYFYNKYDSLDKIINHIYLGDINNAFNKPLLIKYNIKNVISIIHGSYPIYPNDFNYLILDAIDNEKQSIIDLFESSNTFIDNAIKNNENIYIHCIAGVSRSSTLIAAYLIWKYNMKPNDAIDLIKEKRNIVNPNNYFKKQLNDYYDIIINNK